ncbi:MAG: response regulator [Syntrophobacteraceae bacterium]|jgi:DNA-binding response OmpR family regulator
MKRILIIDDDEQICAMLRQMLSKAGYLVDDAPNGDVGVRLYRANPYDLIITDIFMPEREGLETIRELRSDFPDARIIAMSGGGNSGELSYLSLARSFGALQSIVKPFNRRELLESVEKALGSGD